MGGLFSNMTKAGVSQPSGQTQYYDSPEDATAAASKQIPSAESIAGTDALHPNTTVPSPLPKVVQPSVAQATSGGSDPFNSAMTTKGKILSGLLLAARGAAAGAAASVPTNPHISPGLGPALSAGFETPLMMKSQQNQLTQQDLEQQKEKAQIASLPLQAAKQRQLQDSEIDRNEAMADTKGQFTTKPGDIRHDAKGNVIGVGADIGDIANKRETGKQDARADAASDALAAKKKEAEDQGLDADQTMQYVYGIKPKAGYGGKMQAYIDANGGDPKKGVAAMDAHETALQAMKSKVGAIDSGDTPAQARQYEHNPQYSQFKKNRDRLVSNLSDMQSGKTVSTDKQIADQLSKVNDLTDKMTALRATISAKPKASGSLPLQGKAAASAQKYKVGDSVMYQGKQHTVAGYDANGQLQLNQ